MPQDPRLVKGVDEMIAAGDSDQDIALFVQQFKAKFPETPQRSMGDEAWDFVKEAASTVGRNALGVGQMIVGATQPGSKFWAQQAMDLAGAAKDPKATGKALVEDQIGSDEMSSGAKWGRRAANVGMLAAPMVPKGLKALRGAGAAKQALHAEQSMVARGLGDSVSDEVVAAGLGRGPVPPTGSQATAPPAGFSRPTVMETPSTLVPTPSGVVPQGAVPVLPQPGRFKLPEVKNPALALEAAEANDLLKANPMIPQPVTDDLVKARMGERRVTQGDAPSAERRAGPRRVEDQTTPVASSHGPDATFHNNQSYDLKYSTDAQNAASKSKGRAMRAHAAKKADAPPQGMKPNPAARPKMLTDAEIDASKLSDETFIEKGPGAAEDAVSERNYRRRIADERGGIDPALAIPLGGAAVGGAIGSTQDKNPLRGALLGAFGGGALGRIAHKPKNIGPILADTQRAAMLTGLAPLKAILGAAGGVASELGDRAISQSPLRTFKDLKTVVKSLPEAARSIGPALRGTDNAEQASRHLAPVGPFSWPAITAMSAGDAPAKVILKRLGLTAEQASERVLSGAPKSKLGKDTMEFLRKHSITKNILAPVGANTSINVIEQGLLRTPGVNLLPAVRRMDPSATTGKQIGRGVLGAAAGATGAAAYNQLGEKNYLAKGILSAAAGPYAMPLNMVGSTFGKGKPKSYTAAANAMASNLQREAPIRIPQLANAVAEPGKRFTPSVIKLFLPEEKEKTEAQKKAARSGKAITGKKVVGKKVKGKGA